MDGRGSLSQTTDVVFSKFVVLVFPCKFVSSLMVQLPQRSKAVAPLGRTQLTQQ